MDLSFSEFKSLAIETEYIVKKGRSKTSYTLDRKNNDLGYTKDNTQVLTNADNVKKEHERRRTLKVKYNWEDGEYWACDITEKTIQHDDVPF